MVAIVDFTVGHAQESSHENKILNVCRAEESTNLSRNLSPNRWLKSQNCGVLRHEIGRNVESQKTRQVT
jgi:hypothetical protein